MKIKNIRCEYLENPIGIDISNPRINWTLEGIKKQTAYEIEYSVNGYKKSTGRIESSLMRHDFSETFNSRDFVSYNITIYSEDAIIKSETNTFEMGLLDDRDWISKWVSGNYNPNRKRRYPVDSFKKTFECDDVVKARIYISALGVYEAHINENRVGEFYLAPGSTDYRKRVQYQTYDVTDLIKNGENVIDIDLADGWYRGSIGAKGFTYVFGKRTAFIMQLEMIMADGSKRTIISDESFKWSNDGPITFADLKDGEIVDFNLKSTYKGTPKVLNIKKNLSASNNTFARMNETFEPISSFKGKNGNTIYEFKQNLAGIISFKIKGKKNEIIKLRLGEMLVDGDLSLKNIQCIRKNKPTPLQEIVLILDGNEDAYISKFTVMGFKFVEVIGNASISDLKQIAVYSKLNEISSFECSNELINTFYRNTIWSLKSNSLDVPTDCPTRERMGWTGDSQVFFNTACLLTDYEAFSRKHLKDVFDRQDKSGRLPQIAPYNAEDWFMDVMNGSVGWADVGVLIPYRFYKNFGDKRLLEKYYDDIIRYAHFMIRRCGGRKGVYSIYAKPLHLSKENRKYGVNTGQSYGEWAEPNDVKPFEWTDFCMPHPEESMAYTSWVLGIVEEICDILGKENEKPILKEYKEGVKRAYQELVDKKTFDLDTDRQAKLVRPLYMNLLTDEQKNFARCRLIKAIENYNFRLGTGFLSTPFILDVLSKYDINMCYRLLENEEMPGWLYMAKHSTGTIWESWEGPNAAKGVASLNHYSKGAMVEWLFKGMCGLDIIKENEFKVEPIIGGSITYAKAKYDSIYGLISVEWKKENGKIIFDITVPSNTKVKFRYKTFEKTFESGTYNFVL